MISWISRKKTNSTYTRTEDLRIDTNEKAKKVSQASVKDARGSSNQQPNISSKQSKPNLNKVDLTSAIRENSRLDLKSNDKVTQITGNEEQGATKTVNREHYRPSLDLREYQYPPIDLLMVPNNQTAPEDATWLEMTTKGIVNTLQTYNFDIVRISRTVGPSTTLFEIVPAAGMRISKIKNLQNEISLSLGTPGIRMIIPMPGKGTIGIEVRNLKRSIVSLQTLFASEEFQKSNFRLPIAIGKTSDNQNFIIDLVDMSHLLIAGGTDQDKSVLLDSIMVSLLFKKHPSQLKFVLIDTKKITLAIYNTIEKHFLAKLPSETEAIVTSTRSVIPTLNSLCTEMDSRYELFKNCFTRDIKQYNEKLVAGKLDLRKGHQFLPFILVFISDLTDLADELGEAVKPLIERLTMLGSAVGIHLVIISGQPSAKILLGAIKAWIPTRIAFKVASTADSKIILDAIGAEQLNDKGEALISYKGELIRFQCAFSETQDVEKVANFISNQRGYPQAFLLPYRTIENDLKENNLDICDRDPLFEDAARVIFQSQIGSTSLLQRRMKLGYNRASRLMDQLEASGFVGPNEGDKVRDVLIKTDAELEQYLDNLR